jgi:hypothetical protein
MENTTTGEIECNVQVSKNVLSENDIHYILNHENVIINKMNIQKMNIHTEKCNHILFSIQMNDSIRKKLIDAFHLPSLENMKFLPLRWCKGDTEENIDVSHDDNTFDFTHLVYLTSDADGKFIIGDNEYAIEKNIGYKFCEGIKHKTMGCSNERLMIGPFTEDGIQCVGFDVMDSKFQPVGGKKMRCSKRRRTQKSSRTRNATRRRSQRKR